MKTEQKVCVPAAYRGGGLNNQLTYEVFKLTGKKRALKQ